MSINEKLMEDLVNAKPTGGGNYLNHGIYVLIIENFVPKPDGYKGVTFIPEFRILTSAPPADGREHKSGPPNPVNSSVSTAFNVSGGDGGPRAAQAAQGNLRAFVNTLVGEENLAKALLNEALGDTAAKRYYNILTQVLPKSARGALIHSETRIAKVQAGKNAGNEIVVPKWTHIETSKEVCELNKQYLDGKLPIEAALKAYDSAREAAAAASGAPAPAPATAPAAPPA